MASNLRVAPESLPLVIKPTPVKPMPKKNGKWHTVLLAGGRVDFAREIRNSLAESRDIYVKYHLDYERMFQWQRPLPQDIDFCILMTDLCSHEEQGHLWRACKEANVRLIRTVKHLHTMRNAMANFGVKKTAGLPLTVRSTMYFDDEPDPAPLNNCTCKTTPGFPHADFCAEYVKVLALAPAPTPPMPMPASLLAPSPELPVIPVSTVPVELTVKQSIIPTAPGIAPFGMPTPEIGAIAVHLFALCMQQGVDVLIVDGSLTINAKRPN